MRVFVKPFACIRDSSNSFSSFFSLEEKKQKKRGANKAGRLCTILLRYYCSILSYRHAPEPDCVCAVSTSYGLNNSTGLIRFQPHRLTRAQTRSARTNCTRAWLCNRLCLHTNSGFGRCVSMMTIPVVMVKTRLEIPLSHFQIITFSN
jgi:hypothetical protein